MPANSFLKEIGNKSVVDQIVDNITNAIINGDLKPGDKLPSEPELCQSMNVGRNSIREAIKILIAYGVLMIKRGDGTFVMQKFDEKMLYPVIYGIILQKDSANQIIELRKIIDVGILHLTIDYINDESLQQVEEGLQVLKKQASLSKDASEIFEADVEFHRIIVGITKNVMLDSLCHYMDSITKMSRIKAIEKFIKDDAVDDFIFKHDEIVRILRNKSKDEINETVEKHYQYWKDIR